MHHFTPESHRHYLAEIERQVQPRTRDFGRASSRPNLRKGFANVPAMLAVVALLLAGAAGGGLL